MDKLRVLDLFSGIGGFSLGLERTGGFETVAFCEIEEFPRRVLAKHWPEVPCYHDVRDLTADRLAADGIANIDVITGGFPCQDISVAGKRAGLGEGTRSGLWSEIIRLAGELRPRFIIVENVANLLSGPSERRGGWFGRVLGDLAECGYDAEWENISASAVGAHHKRERVWLIAYADEGRNGHWQRPTRSQVGMAPIDPNTHAPRQLQSQGVLANIGRWIGDIPQEAFAGIDYAHKPLLGRTVHGLPNRVDRVGSLGNAVVPQIPELIGHAILEAEGAHA